MKVSGDIKYRLVANRSLKHGECSRFMKYLFESFDERTAKSMANQFIVHLVRSTTRTNMGSPPPVTRRCFRFGRRL